MKTAVCFSGLLRDYQRYLPRLKAQVEALDADVFIHTWNDLYDDGCHPVTQADFALLSSELKPKCIDIDSLSKRRPAMEALSKWDVKKEHITSKGAANFGFMFYSIFAANFLRCAWGKYDLVVRQRFDQAFKEPITAADLNVDMLNVVPINRTDGVADIWAASNSTIMNCYSDVFHHFDECAAEIKFIRPEDVLKVWLDKNKVPINVIGRSYDIK